MPDADLQDLLAQCIDRIAEVGRVSAAETVLAAHPEHAAVLRDRLGKLLRAGLLPVAAEPAPAGHPERLGDFLLVRQLGRGGMGVVYLARQESLGRDVALKLVHPELLYFPGARERFRREVEAVARLQDPGIVPIYTVGEDDGVPYFAMEYVGGATLADILGDLHRRQPGSLTGDELHRLVAARAGRDGDAATELFAGTWVEVGCRIVRRMALAAHHAHERGVLHRDIKPSNAMLTPDGRVLLLDFGLAAADGTSSLTRSGAVVGTLHYMAPEQLRGEAMDARTDVYALGATLYELLALETPHRADTADGLRHAILHGAIAPLRARDHGVPRDVETIVRRALDLEPARRYASAAALAEDLERFLQRRPVLARRAGPALRARRWMQRHPAWATAVLLIVLGSGAVGVVAWQRESARRESAANLDNALRAIGTLLDRARDPRLAMTPGLDPVRAQQLDDAVDLLLRLHRENDGSRAVRFALAHGLLQAAELRSTLGDAQRSLDAAALAVTELEALRGEDPDNTRVRVESARGQRARATARRQLADLPGARTDTERGLAVLAERGEAKDPEAPPSRRRATPTWRCSTSRIGTPSRPSPTCRWRARSTTAASPPTARRRRCSTPSARARTSPRRSSSSVARPTRWPSSRPCARCTPRPWPRGRTTPRPGARTRATTSRWRRHTAGCSVSTRRCASAPPPPPATRCS
ncbi:MAG: serine/threonine-protein kinase [Planctomycetota bacterium]